MENKLPEKYENSFLNKIKRFFTGLFKKNVIASKSEEVIQNKKIEVKQTETEFNKMKGLGNKTRLKEDILTLIESNPDAIKNLSIENLKKLDSMYDEIIEENNRKIKKLKREIA